MGNNDSLPPPPLPGSTPDLPPTQPSAVIPPPLSGGPVPPPAPPAVPQFPPTEPMAVQPGSPEMTPTTQMPSTFAQPLQPVQGQPYPGQPDPGMGGATPPGGVPPTGQPPASGGGNNKLPWIIAAAVAVVAVVVVAVVLLTGDDNTTSSAGTTTIVPESSASSTTLVPSTTVVPETTLVITTPSTTATTTTPTTAAPGVIVAADDTGTFTVLMLDTFQIDSSPTEREGLTLANVTGSEDVATFIAGTNLDLFGVAVSIGPTAQLPSVDELLNSADPGDSVCSNRVRENDYPTQLGTAQVLLLDGCGTGGLSGQVAMVLPIGGTDLTMLVSVRGPGPSNTDLLDFAQAVAESVVVL